MASCNHLLWDSDWEEATEKRNYSSPAMARLAVLVKPRLLAQLVWHRHTRPALRATRDGQCPTTATFDRDDKKVEHRNGRMDGEQTESL